MRPVTLNVVGLFQKNKCIKMTSGRIKYNIIYGYIILYLRRLFTNFYHLFIVHLEYGIEHFIGWHRINHMVSNGVFLYSLRYTYVSRSIICEDCYGPHFKLKILKQLKTWFSIEILVILTIFRKLKKLCWDISARYI